MYYVIETNKSKKYPEPVLCIYPKTSPHIPPAKYIDSGTPYRNKYWFTCERLAMDQLSKLQGGETK